MNAVTLSKCSEPFLLLGLKEKKKSPVFLVRFLPCTFFFFFEGAGGSREEVLIWSQQFFVLLRTFCTTRSSVVLKKLGTGASR